MEFCFVLTELNLMLPYLQQKTLNKAKERKQCNSGAMMNKMRSNSLY